MHANFQAWTFSDGPKVPVEFPGLTCRVNQRVTGRLPMLDYAVLGPYAEGCSAAEITLHHTDGSCCYRSFLAGIDLVTIRTLSDPHAFCSRYCYTRI